MMIEEKEAAILRIEAQVDSLTELRDSQRQELAALIAALSANGQDQELAWRQGFVGR